MYGVIQLREDSIRGDTTGLSAVLKTCTAKDDLAQGVRSSFLCVSVAHCALALL